MDAFTGITARNRLRGMASPHAGVLIGASAAVAAVGGSFMAVTASEPSKAPRSIWANIWFDLGFSLVILGLGVLAIALFLHFWGKASRRIEVDITPEQLTGFFKGVTDVQGQDRAARYVGKWMRVSGSLLNVALIARHSVMASFAERPVGSAAEVYCFFSRRKWTDRIVVKSRGDHATVLGRIDEVTRQVVYLGDCELETQRLHNAVQQLPRATTTVQLPDDENEGSA